MSDQTMPVLWLCGPPGVGKTTVAWEVYAGLARQGIAVGYVDVDQLGMCYPEQASDRGRYRMQAGNLDAVVTAFHQAGVRRLVVSGVVDPTLGAHTDRMPRVGLTMVRLRAADDELIRRLTGRQGGTGMVSEALAEARALDAAGFGQVCIDTTGRPVADVVRLVREHTTDWASASQRIAPRRGPRAQHRQRRPSAPSGLVLWLCGTTGVGKSTVGFEIFMRTVFDRRIPGAYVDLDQFGFVTPAPSDRMARHRMKAQVLAALWERFHRGGARCLTMVGPAEDQAAIDVYGDALPRATLTVCRLHAGLDELANRILLRGRGRGWAQPGDPLRGQPVARLRHIADLAAAHADALERRGVGDLRIDTDKRTAKEIADAILGHTAWPDRTR